MKFEGLTICGINYRISGKRLPSRVAARNGYWYKQLILYYYFLLEFESTTLA